MVLLLIIIALAASVATLVLAFLSVRSTSAMALVALLTVFFGMPVAYREGAATHGLIYWGVACLVALALNYTLPRYEATSRHGVGYLTGGAILGGVIVYFMSISYVVIGVVVGAFLGSLAYVKTPAGKHYEFPSPDYMQWLCSKGLPVMITVSVALTVIYQACFTLANA